VSTDYYTKAIEKFKSILQQKQQQGGMSILILTEFHGLLTTMGSTELSRDEEDLVQVISKRYNGSSDSPNSFVVDTDHNMFQDERMFLQVHYRILYIMTI
jgi:hypothetical protein